MSYKVIGIISYLPDDEEKRQARFKKLCGLIQTCNQLFNLPIHIIIQNYYEEDTKILQKCNNCVLSPNYSRLGIVGARKKLREWFLSSPYDCLIMLDDDCEIIGTTEGAKQYLSILDAHEGYFGEFRGTQLKLFAIYKNLLKYVDFADINPENSEGFEDTLFVEKLKKKFPKRGFSFYEVQNLKEVSLGVGDELSTWYDSQDIKEMLYKTEEGKGKI